MKKKILISAVLFGMALIPSSAHPSEREFLPAGPPTSPSRFTALSFAALKDVVGQQQKTIHELESACQELRRQGEAAAHDKQQLAIVVDRLRVHTNLYSHIHEQTEAEVGTALEIQQLLERKAADLEKKNRLLESEIGAIRASMEALSFNHEAQRNLVLEQKQRIRMLEQEREGLNAVQPALESPSSGPAVRFDRVAQLEAALEEQVQCASCVQQELERARATERQKDAHIAALERTVQDQQDLLDRSQQRISANTSFVGTDLATELAAAIPVPVPSETSPVQKESKESKMIARQAQTIRELHVQIRLLKAALAAQRAELQKNSKQ